MYLPNTLSFRQVFLITFILILSKTASADESGGVLYDELKFLEEASKKVTVYLPSAPQVIEDQITIQSSGIEKKSLNTDTYNTEPRVPVESKKRLRFRSR